MSSSERPPKDTLQFCYGLGRRNGVYYISTQPAEPVHHGFLSSAYAGNAKPCALAGQLNDLGLDSTPEYQPATGEYQLKPLLHNAGASVYSTRIGCREYVVKLDNDALNGTDRCLRQVNARRIVLEGWSVATSKLGERGLRPILIPDAVSRITSRTLSGGMDVREGDPAGYIMECIPPLKLKHAQALAGLYLDPNLADCVRQDPVLSNVRLNVRLGELSPPDEDMSSEFLSRPAYLDQLILEAPGMIFEWVTAMGVTLALLHWGCNLDAQGVDIMLAPRKSKMRMWLVGFGHCKPFGRGAQGIVETLVKAVIDNPAWPRPESAPNFASNIGAHESVVEIWSIFREGYLKASGEILPCFEPSIEELGLPIRFITALESAWQQQADQK
ncbi:hypothetical protein ACJZ2D_002531 [Fusarium nematophilum]